MSTNWGVVFAQRCKRTTVQAAGTARFRSEQALTWEHGASPADLGKGFGSEGPPASEREASRRTSKPWVQKQGPGYFGTGERVSALATRSRGQGDGDTHSSRDSRSRALWVSVREPRRCPCLGPPLLSTVLRPYNIILNSHIFGGRVVQGGGIASSGGPTPRP